MIFIAVRFHNTTISKWYKTYWIAFYNGMKNNVVMETLIQYENVKDIIIKIIIFKDG